jgi:hypothetical protein
MSSDIPEAEPPKLRLAPARQLETLADVAADLRMGAAELAGALQNWPDRIPVRNSITSIIEAAASYDFRVVDGLGEAAFRLDDERRRLEFSASAISSLRKAATEIADEVRPSDVPFAADMNTLGDRLFTFHELTHVAQTRGTSKQSSTLSSCRSSRWRSWTLSLISPRSRPRPASTAFATEARLRSSSLPHACASACSRLRWACAPSVSETRSNAPASSAC